MAAAAAVSAMLLSGCMGGGLDFASDMTVDKAVKTGSVPGARDRLSDEITVKNAVSSTDLSRNAGTPVPWANTASGSAGVINQIAESHDPEGRTCRDFVTTRHSYQGIANFSGRTCLTRDGEWLLTAFDRQG
ncbi:MAG: RT0821/Lpp0805 family surface protein [Shinella sp.]|nr:RT0821/Lpp0805 family surface protein [Shinella sp.]